MLPVLRAENFLHFNQCWAIIGEVPILDSNPFKGFLRDNLLLIDMIRFTHDHDEVTQLGLIRRN